MTIIKNEQTYYVTENSSNITITKFIKCIDSDVFVRTEVVQDILEFIGRLSAENGPCEVLLCFCELLLLCSFVYAAIFAREKITQNMQFMKFSTN